MKSRKWRRHTCAPPGAPFAKCPSPSGQLRKQVQSVAEQSPRMNHTSPSRLLLTLSWSSKPVRWAASCKSVNDYLCAFIKAVHQSTTDAIEEDESLCETLLTEDCSEASQVAGLRGRELARGTLSFQCENRSRTLRNRRPQFLAPWFGWLSTARPWCPDKAGDASLVDSDLHNVNFRGANAELQIYNARILLQ